MRSFTLPDWTKDLPDETRLGSKEVAEIFGYKLNGLQSLMRDGYIPPPDMDLRVGYKIGWSKNRVGRKRLYWKLGTLRRLEKKDPDQPGKQHES
jgi:hypothetical protein